MNLTRNKQDLLIFFLFLQYQQFSPSIFTSWSILSPSSSPSALHSANTMVYFLMHLKGDNSFCYDLTSGIILSLPSLSLGYHDRFVTNDLCIGPKLFPTRNLSSNNGSALVLLITMWLQDPVTIVYKPNIEWLEIIAFIPTILYVVAKYDMFSQKSIPLF